MNFWKALGGMVTVTLTGADPAASLQTILDRGIPMDRVVWVEELTIRFRCASHHRNTLSLLCKKRGDSLSFSGETGIRNACRMVMHRPVLALGCLLFFFLTLFLPTRVLFFQVEGNERIPARQILEAAADCGIRFGVSRRQVRSEKMKNALLGAMPTLKWAGINTSGCTAVISVRERSLQEEQPEAAGASSIVAVRDAYLTACIVTRGSALCTPGQVVKQGQILISGVTDLGLQVQVTQAQGEVFGETNRELKAVTQLGRENRVEQTWAIRRYGLILGKKRINFWKGSGISPATCGRMYKEYYLTLPGGFQLPLCLTVETLENWTLEASEAAMEDVEQTLKAFSRHQVLKETLAGSILSEEWDISAENGICLLEGRFRCSEMIGRVVKEEITNGKTD